MCQSDFRQSDAYNNLLREGGCRIESLLSATKTIIVRFRLLALFTYILFSDHVILLFCPDYFNWQKKYRAVMIKIAPLARHDTDKGRD